MHIMTCTGSTINTKIDLRTLIRKTFVILSYSVSTSMYDENTMKLIA